MTAEPETLTGLLRRGSGQLRAAGVPDPRAIALALLAGHRGESVPALLWSATVEASDREIRWLDQAITRYLGGEPLAYLVGHAGFRHLDLLVDSRVLIPRPETESVVGEALTLVNRGVTADIGTGSGAIALALRQEGQFERVFGCDISTAALELARRNGERNSLSVEWLEGDLLAPLRHLGIQVDLLISNPPYLTTVEHGSLERSVRDFEPAVALVSGEDGMAATTRLLQEAPGVLKPGGFLVLEVDSRRGAQAAGLAREAGWEEVQLRDDLFGRVRTLTARWGMGR